MFVEFRVKNYRSFKERVSLSMEAADIASHPSSLDVNNVFAVTDDLKLLTSAAIYGANASGKSNIISALRAMRNLILDSSRETQVDDLISVEPYQLSTDTEDQPSEFELVFLVDGTQYRYGFSVNVERVIEEWLYRLGKAREVMLFSRDIHGIKISKRSFSEGNRLEALTRPNALFLSVVAQFNGLIASSLLRWFRNLSVNTGIDDTSDMVQALHSFEHSLYRSHIEQLIQRLDVNIDGFELDRSPAMLPSSMPQEIAEQMRAVFEILSKDGGTPESITIKTFHQRFDTEGKPIDKVIFDLNEQESAGTRRLFTIAYPLIRALQEGLVLIIDEIDARIHPNLAIELIQLFNDKETNPRYAQLIFTTHNTNLLNAKLFRRDQIWFTEKSRQGASDLYSLIEYRVDGKIVRNDASFEKDYVAGRYGAVPFIGDLRALLGAEYAEAHSG